MTLRERDPLARITVVGGESPYFFSRTALMYAYMGALERRAMEPYERKVYRERRIDLVHDRVTDLDAAARTVTTAKGAAIPYDGLLIAAGSAPRALAAPACRSDDRKISISQMSNLDLVKSQYSQMDCQSVRSCVQWDPTAMPTACGCFRSGLQLDGRTTYLNNASYQLRVVFIGCTGLEPQRSACKYATPASRGTRGAVPAFRLPPMCL
jgi:NADPH-dependent 2,4-dienoyl-CoA reductase/sulfur reductase-like enzyme